MKIPKAYKRKSPLLARVLSYLIPGLGFYYLGDKIKGVTWLVVGILIFSFAIAESFQRNSAGQVMIQIRWVWAALYLVFLIYSAEMAARDCLDYNTNLSLQEEIEYKKQLKEKGLRG